MLLLDFLRKTLIGGGKNNIEIQKGLNVRCSISGENNTVKIFGCDDKKKIKTKIKIKINGNNNTVIIKGIKTVKRLYIGVGSTTPCEGINIEIGNNFTCVDTTILAYQHNVPIKIGDDCLFSKDVIIRSGELPHQIYDTITGENLDNSNGISIGNHVWIGESVYIMKKVKISDNSIVGSASVVTRKFDEENVVIAGNPAEIRRRNISWK